MSDEHRHSRSRRRLLGGAAALAGLTVAPGVFLVHARPAAAGDGGRAVRWGLLVDAGRCRAGCEACVAACREENGWHGRGEDPGAAQWIRKVTLRRDRGPSRTLPVMCQHCAAPPCAKVCPVGASFKRDDGIVLVDKHRCIGCRYCIMACPFQARFFAHEPIDTEPGDYPRGRGTAESCTLCVHRIDRGERPACVERCAREGGGALVFGDLNDPGSEIARRLAAHGGEAVRADLELDPGVRYQGIS